MRTFTIALVFALLAALPSVAQTEIPQPTFIVNHPAVKVAVERCLAEQTTAAAISAKSTGARFAAVSPVFGGGYSLATPPVALRLNRVQYDEHDVLQVSLVVLPDVPLSNAPVGLSVLWVHLDSNYTRGTYAGRHVLLAGETIPLQTYVFDGSEQSGLYALVVMVIDAVTGQLVAMPGTHFVFRCFTSRYDTRGYSRVDGASEMVGPYNGGRFVTLQGNFQSQATSGQFVLIGSWQFPIIKSTATTAIVDLTGASLPAGVHDVTLVVHTPGNVAYDSTTAPCALRLFLPSGKG